MPTMRWYHPLRRTLAFLLAVTLAAPNSAWALRQQHSESEKVTAGLEEMLREDSSQTAQLDTPAPLATPAQAPTSPVSVGPRETPQAGMEEDVRQAVQRFLSRRLQMRRIENEVLDQIIAKPEEAFLILSPLLEAMRPARKQRLEKQMRTANFKAELEQVIQRARKGVSSVAPRTAGQLLGLLDGAAEAEDWKRFESIFGSRRLRRGAPYVGFVIALDDIKRPDRKWPALTQQALARYARKLLVVDERLIPSEVTLPTALKIERHFPFLEAAFLGDAIPAELSEAALRGDPVRETNLAALGMRMTSILAELIWKDTEFGRRMAREWDEGAMSAVEWMRKNDPDYRIWRSDLLLKTSDSSGVSSEEEWRERVDGLFGVQSETASRAQTGEDDLARMLLDVKDAWEQRLQDSPVGPGLFLRDWTDYVYLLTGIHATTTDDVAEELKQRVGDESWMRTVLPTYVVIGIVLALLGEGFQPTTFQDFLTTAERSLISGPYAVPEVLLQAGVKEVLPDVIQRVVEVTGYPLAGLEGGGKAVHSPQTIVHRQDQPFVPRGPLLTMDYGLSTGAQRLPAAGLEQGRVEASLDRFADAARNHPGVLVVTQSGLEEYPGLAKLAQHREFARRMIIYGMVAAAQRARLQAAGVPVIEEGDFDGLVLALLAMPKADRVTVLEEADTLARTLEEALPDSMKVIPLAIRAVGARIQAILAAFAPEEELDQFDAMALGTLARLLAA